MFLANIFLIFFIELMYVKNTPLKLDKEKSEVGDLYIY